MSTDAIRISGQDVKFAERFLATYLQEKHPDADFSEGTAMRDLVVGAMASLFAFLRKEVETVKNHQSILRLASSPPSPDVDEAVEALLSNWFLTKKPGQRARVTATLHFSAPTDVVLEPTTRFFKAGGIAFVPDIPSTSVVSKNDLRIQVSETGETTYALGVSLVALDEGDAGNIPPGRFQRADTFNPFFVFAENATEGVDGRGEETTQEILARAPNAITVRNLVNQRSISTVLDERFPVREVLTLGFGQPEMKRDLVDAGTMHIGGHTDTYVALNRADVVERGVVGGVFNRPDRRLVVIRDPDTDFVAAGVSPGDVARIYLENEAPRGFVIAAVYPHELEVKDRTPLREEGLLHYSVGRLSPAFDDVLPVRPGTATASIRIPNGFVLQGRPHYWIHRIELTAEGSSTVLTHRVNSPVNLQEDEFCVETRNPFSAQSAHDTSVVHVHPAHAGKEYQIVYETLVGYEPIQDFVVSPFERILSSNPLVRGYHPIYVSGSLTLQTRRHLSEEELDAISSSLAERFNQTDVIDISGLSQHVRNQYPLVSALLGPPTLHYTLISPDGQLVKYRTQDLATLFPSPEASALLVNGAELKKPILDNPTLQRYLEDLGVSDRTARFFCRASDIEIVQVV